MKLESLINNFPDNLIILLSICYECMYLCSYRLNIQQTKTEILKSWKGLVGIGRWVWILVLVKTRNLLS